MDPQAWTTFLAFGIFALLLFVAGIYCILVTRNLIRLLIGLELLTKGVTLLLIAAGYVTGRVALTQALVITLIAIEVVIMVVGGGIALSAYKHTETLDSRRLQNLKG